MTRWHIDVLDRSAAKPRAASLVLLLGCAVGFFNAGLAWMTHLHHDGLRHVEPVRMAAYDLNYELLSSLVVVPLSVVSFACAAALVLLRHPCVPRWLPAVAAALQVAVWTVRTVWWGPLAEQTRTAGWVARDGALEPAYAQYMDSNWIRIGLLTCYALLVLMMAALTLVRAAPTSRSSG